MKKRVSNEILDITGSAKLDIENDSKVVLWYAGDFSPCNSYHYLHSFGNRIGFSLKIDVVESRFADVAQVLALIDE